MKYAVTVRATITKTIEVEAENELKAQEMAHEMFSVENDGGDEDYDQDVISCEKVGEQQ